jgi:hypothetical protein
MLFGSIALSACCLLSASIFLATAQDLHNIALPSAFLDARKCFFKVVLLVEDLQILQRTSTDMFTYSLITVPSLLPSHEPQNR